MPSAPFSLVLTIALIFIASWNMKNLLRTCILAFFLELLAVFTIGMSQECSAEIGESLQMKENEALTIRAKDLTYFSAQQLFVAEGEVEITYRTARLTADYIEFHENTGDALAIGNVVYEEGVETLTADRAEFNLDTELGTLSTGKLSLANDQYFTGKQIIKTGENTYTLNHGTFTACDSASPAWKFRSSKATIEEDEYIQAWNTVGFVKGIPVFYFPYFVYPIKSERQSGVLVPDIGNSSSNGFTISNAFFWAMTDSQDATFRHTYYNLRGNKFDVEYRYKYSAETDGTLVAEYVHKDRIDSKSKKRLVFNHRQNLPYSIKGRVNLDLTDNDQFDKDFNTQLDERSNTYLQSNLSLTRNFSQHTVKLLFDRLDDLRATSEDRQDQRFPEFSVSSQEQQIFGSPVYFRQTSTIARLLRDGKPEEFLEVTRADIHPVFSLPINFGSALTLSPELDVRKTYYSEFYRKEQSADDSDKYVKVKHSATDRDYYSARLGVNGPRFQRIFNFDRTRRTQKMKHLVEPTLSYSYTPGITQQDLPKFDGVDQIGSADRSRTLSYSLTQRLLTKRITANDWDRFQRDEEELLALEDLATETEEIASLILSQSYNFEADTRNFNDVAVTLNLQPFRNYKLTVQTAYDIYVNSFVTTSVNLSGNLWDAWDVDARWRRSVSVDEDNDKITDVKQYLDFNTSLALFGRVKLAYRGRFDLTEDERIEDTLGLTYNGQCWSIFGNLQQQLIDDERDTGFQILLELKHLGKLLDIKG